MKKQKLPPIQNVGRNLKDVPHLKLDGYHVSEWCPEEDGLGKSQEVHIVFDLVDPQVSFVLALKSPRALDEMVGVLLRSRNSVWPETKD